MKSDKPWMSSGPSGYRTHSERYPMDLFSYTREAAHCRDERRFLAVIAMSSTAVELIINRDTRTRKARALKRTAGWANLNNHNLRVARENGLPVDALLEAGDNLSSDDPIAFVHLRNKVAHGEIEPFISDLSDYDPAAEKLANEHESKMRKFVSEWYNTAPDVQEGRASVSTIGKRIENRLTRTRDLFGVPHLRPLPSGLGSPLAVMESLPEAS
jgi:hypothetical protein